MRRRLLALVFWLLLPSVSWAATASDDFNRPDGEIGANWTAVTGMGLPDIFSNQIRADDGTGGCLGGVCEGYWNGISPAGASFSQLTITAWNPGVSQIAAGTLLRVDTGTRTYYACYANNDGSSTAKIQEYSDGIGADLSSDPVAWTISDVIRCEANGEALSFQKNGATVSTVTDATLTSGRVGVALYSSANPIDTQADNWSGGDLGTAGNSSRRIIVIE